MSTDNPETGGPPDRPATLEEALGGPVGDRASPDDGIRSLWEDLATVPATAAASATTAGTVRRGPAVTDLPGPAGGVGDGEDGPAAEPLPTTRRERRTARRQKKDLERSENLTLRRHRVLPRTVIGISMLLLAAAVGAALSGAVLYAYYDWRLAENEDRVGTLAATLEERLAQASEDIDNVQTQAVNDIRKAAEPLEQLLSDTRTVSDLTPALAPSVFFVSTLDTNGAPSVGSGFVVSSDASASLVLTSYRTVAAATATPAPDIELRGEGGPFAARLYSWDADRDLALLLVDRGDLPPLDWASEETRANALGRRVYVASGLGGAGVSLSPGLVVDQSRSGIQHSAPMGNAWQGGPLLTAEGEVIGIASLAYAPLGFPPGGVPFAVPVDQACEQVLTCSGGDVTG